MNDFCAEIEQELKKSLQEQIDYLDKKLAKLCGVPVCYLEYHLDGSLKWWHEGREGEYDISVYKINEDITYVYAPRFGPFRLGSYYVHKPGTPEYIELEKKYGPKKDW